MWYVSAKAGGQCLHWSLRCTLTGKVNNEHALGETLITKSCLMQSQATPTPTPKCMLQWSFGFLVRCGRVVKSRIAKKTHPTVTVEVGVYIELMQTGQGMWRARELGLCCLAYLTLNAKAKWVACSVLRTFIVIDAVTWELLNRRIDWMIVDTGCWVIQKNRQGRSGKIFLKTINTFYKYPRVNHGRYLGPNRMHTVVLGSSIWEGELIQ